MSAYVYFIGPASGAVKIGTSSSPARRLKQMQTGNPDVLRLLAVTPGGKRREEQVHARFRSAHLRGEWFRRTPDLEAFVDAQRALNAETLRRLTAPKALARPRTVLDDHQISARDKIRAGTYDERDVAAMREADLYGNYTDYYRRPDHVAAEWRLREAV